jgi:para-nitrobenzyl esterase
MVLKELGIAPKEWRRLLAVPAAELLRIQSLFPPIPPHRRPRTAAGNAEAAARGFGPVVDGVALPAHPFDPTAPDISRDKPLITGWNEDEYTFFAWEWGDTGAFDLDSAGLHAKLEPHYGSDTKHVLETYRHAMPTASATDIYLAIASITMMGLGSVEIAERKAAQGGAPVYVYQFGYKSEAKVPGTAYAVGTPHAMDITFKFNNETPHNSPGFLSGNNPDRFIASHMMAELWTSFARTGRPAAAGAPAWPAYTLEDRATMRIATRCEVMRNRYSHELAMWRAIGMLS